MALGDSGRARLAYLQDARRGIPHPILVRSALGRVHGDLRLGLR